MLRPVNVQYWKIVSPSQAGGGPDFTSYAPHAISMSASPAPGRAQPISTTIPSKAGSMCAGSSRFKVP